MTRRLLFFGFGALISIFFLSMGPENRLKDTFYAYIDYFDMDKRVISHLYPNTTDDEGNIISIDPDFSTKAECQLVYYNLTKEELLTVREFIEATFRLLKSVEELPEITCTPPLNVVVLAPKL